MKHRFAEPIDPAAAELAFFARSLTKPSRKRNFEEQRESHSRFGKRTFKHKPQFERSVSGSIVIVRFFDGLPNGPCDILIQQDINNDGTPKGKLGFVIGGPNKGETDEEAGLRETEEEAGISKDVGYIVDADPEKTYYPDRRRHDPNPYYTAAYVKTVPYNTPHTPGAEIYKNADGYALQTRFTRDEVISLYKERRLLFKHSHGFGLALAKGLI